jgi:hypothetical protein
MEMTSQQVTDNEEEEVYTETRVLVQEPECVRQEKEYRCFFLSWLSRIF